MKNIIIIEKTNKKERLSKSIMDTTMPADIAWALSLVDLTRWYMWAMSNANLATINELEQTSIKKYWRHARQMKWELDYLYNCILAAAIFVWYLHEIYNIEKVIKNIKVRQDIIWEWMSYFFIKLYKYNQFWKMDGKDISDAIKRV